MDPRAKTVDISGVLGDRKKIESEAEVFYQKNYNSASENMQNFQKTQSEKIMDSKSDNFSRIFFEFFDDSEQKRN